MSAPPTAASAGEPACASATAVSHAANAAASEASGASAFASTTAAAAAVAITTVRRMPRAVVLKKTGKPTTMVYPPYGLSSLSAEVKTSKVQRVSMGKSTNSVDPTYGLCVTAVESIYDKTVRICFRCKSTDEGCDGAANCLFPLKVILSNKENTCAICGGEHGPIIAHVRAPLDRAPRRAMPARTSSPRTPPRTALRHAGARSSGSKRTSGAKIPPVCTVALSVATQCVPSGTAAGAPRKPLRERKVEPPSRNVHA